MTDIDYSTVLLVSGSPRPHGNTDLLLQAVGKGLEARGLSTTFVPLRSYAIHSCIGCERCRTDKTCSRFYDGMHILYPLIERAGGLVVGSPTYNYNLTPEMKCFIDRFYPFFDFGSQRPGPYSSRLAEAGRMLVSLAVCEQNEVSEMGYTLKSMTDAFRAMGYGIAAELAVTGHFAKGSVSSDEETLLRAEHAGDALADALQGGGPS